MFPLKKALFSVCLFVIVSSVHAQSVTRYFTDTSCLITSLPMRVLSGQQLVIQCDTAYLVNKFRFKLYEKSRVFIQTMDPENQKAAIEEYEKSLNLANKSYQEINQKYKSVFDLHKKDLEAFQTRLDIVAKELDTAKSELNIARKDLEDARKQISRKRNSSLKSALIWAGSGLATGIVLGIIFVP